MFSLFSLMFFLSFVCRYSVWNWFKFEFFFLSFFCVLFWRVPIDHTNPVQFKYFFFVFKSHLHSFYSPIDPFLGNFYFFHVYFFYNFYKFLLLWFFSPVFFLNIIFFRSLEFKLLIISRQYLEHTRLTTVEIQKKMHAQTL